MPISATINDWLGSYGAFVVNLRAGVLVALAAATAFLGATCCISLEKPSIQNNADVIITLSILYIIGLSVFIYQYRNNNPLLLPPPPQPQPPPPFPNTRAFLKSVFPVLALAFFTTVDDPMKSLKSLYVVCICICSYFHILVLLAVLRRTEDYGVSDGCLAATYGLLFNMTELIMYRIMLIPPIIILSGLRNLQFHALRNPPLLPPLNLNEVVVNDGGNNGNDGGNNGKASKAARRHQIKERRIQNVIRQPQAHRHNRHSSL